MLNIALCFCKDIPVVTVINHKQSFSLSRKYSNIHGEEYLWTLAFASTAFLHNKIKLHFVTFYRSHCHFHHSIMYSVNKAIKNNIIHSNFSTWQESLNVTTMWMFYHTRHGAIYLLHNPHSNNNSIVPQIYKSAFRQSKKAGFKTYFLQQQQIRWALNNEIEDLSKKVNNLLKEEKYAVCQNIKTFLKGVERCTSSDVANLSPSLIWTI